MENIEKQVEWIVENFSHSPQEASERICSLLCVSESKSPTLNDVQRYYYQRHHFDETGKVMNQYVKENDSVIHELILGFCKNFYSR